MTIIDPAVLRAQTAALTELTGQPPLLAAKVHELLDDYADRTYRASPRLIGNHPASALKTPAPVLRAIIVALRGFALASPSAMLEVVKAIWAGGSREERRVAAELLGHAAPRVPEKAHWLVEALLPEIESAETADALAEHGLAPLIRAAPAAYVAHAQHWAQSQRKWTRRFALAVLQPLLKDKQWDSVPGALEAVRAVMTDPEAEVRSAAVATLRALTPKSPVEVGRFLRQQAESPHHNAQTIVRLTLAKLPPDTRAEVERVMRL